MRAPLIAATVLLLAACTSKTATGSPTSTSPTAAPPVGPAAPTPGPVPAELSGTWRAVGTRQKMVLQDQTFKFFINPDNAASGQALVEGAKILFTGSSDCPGDGLYFWALTGGKLHFTAANQDPCPRSENLNGRDWVRAG